MAEGQPSAQSEPAQDQASAIAVAEPPTDADAERPSPAWGNALSLDDDVIDLREGVIWRNPLFSETQDQRIERVATPLYEVAVGGQRWLHAIWSSSTEPSDAQRELTDRLSGVEPARCIKLASLYWPASALAVGRRAVKSLAAMPDNPFGPPEFTSDTEIDEFCTVLDRRNSSSSGRAEWAEQQRKAWDGKPARRGFRCTYLPFGIAQHLGEDRTLGTHELGWSFTSGGSPGVRADELEIYVVAGDIISVGRFVGTKPPASYPGRPDHGFMMAVVAQCFTRADDPFGVLAEAPPEDAENPAYLRRLRLNTSRDPLQLIRELESKLDEEMSGATSIRVWLANHYRYRLREWFMTLRARRLPGEDERSGADISPIDRIRELLRLAETLEAEADDSADATRAVARHLAPSPPAQLSDDLWNDLGERKRKLAREIAAVAASCRRSQRDLGDLVSRFATDLTRYEFTEALQSQRDELTRRVTVVGGIAALILAGGSVAAAIAAVPSLHPHVLEPSQALIVRALAVAGIIVMWGLTAAGAVGFAATRTPRPDLQKGSLKAWPGALSGRLGIWRHKRQVLAAGASWLGLLVAAIHPAGTEGMIALVGALAVMIATGIHVAWRWDPSPSPPVRPATRVQPDTSSQTPA